MRYISCSNKASYTPSRGPCTAITRDVFFTNMILDYEHQCLPMLHTLTHSTHVGVTSSLSF